MPSILHLSRVWQIFGHKKVPHSEGCHSRPVPAAHVSHTRDR